MPFQQSTELKNIPLSLCVWNLHSLCNILIDLQGLRTGSTQQQSRYISSAAHNGCHFLKSGSDLSQSVSQHQAAVQLESSRSTSQTIQGDCIHSFIHSFFLSFIHSFHFIAFHFASLIYSFSQSCIQSFHFFLFFIHSFIHSCMHACMHSVSQSFIHSFISFFHSFTHSFIFFHSFHFFHFIFSFTHSFIHSFIRSFHFMSCHFIAFIHSLYVCFISFHFISCHSCIHFIHSFN